MKTFRFMLITWGVVGCAMGPKVPQQSQLDERERRPDLSDFLGEVDPKRSNEADGETRHLLRNITTALLLFFSPKSGPMSIEK